MNIDNLTPETQLRRKDVAEASTAHGFPIKEKTLATMASRGGGPPFKLWGRIPLYTWGPYLAWAESRLSEPRSSTSEADAATSRVERVLQTRSQPIAADSSPKGRSQTPPSKPPAPAPAADASSA
jgi:hypothetical protein